LRFKPPLTDQNSSNPVIVIAMIAWMKKHRRDTRRGTPAYRSNGDWNSNRLLSLPFPPQEARGDELMRWFKWSETVSSRVIEISGANRFDHETGRDSATLAGWRTRGRKMRIRVGRQIAGAVADRVDTIESRS